LKYSAEFEITVNYHTYTSSLCPIFHYFFIHLLFVSTAEVM